jgi:hypothetical protein
MAVFTIALVTLQPGTRDLGPVTVPDADTRLRIILDRTVAGGFDVTPAASAMLVMSQSDDGGATWQPLASMGPITGGPQTFKDQPKTSEMLGTGFNPGTGRRLKATLDVTGAAVAVAGTVQTG